GMLGDGWLTGQNTPDEDLVGQLDAYRTAAARAGRPQRAVLRRDIFVAESDAAAHAEVDRILAEGYRGTGKAELLVGSPTTVIDRLRHYRGLGFEEVMVRHITGDHGKMLDSFALIGQHVMPPVRQSQRHQPPSSTWGPRAFSHSVASSSRPSGVFAPPASTTSPTKIEWSPRSTVSTRRHSTNAGALSRMGAPVEPQWKGSP